MTFSMRDAPGPASVREGHGPPCLLLVSILAGCAEGPREVQSVTYDDVDALRNVFSASEPLPSEVLEFDFVEYDNEPRGMLPGPTDFSAYLRIRVAVDDVGKWVAGLEPPFNGTTDYAHPWTDQDWWLSADRFDDMRLYETKTHFGRYNGWLGVDEARGFIYAYTFTL